jgi:hypothetical protein
MDETGPQPTSSGQSRTAATRVVEYVRISTEHQQYSKENQRKIIRQYAEARGMSIVQTYTDAGKSGLRIDGRDAPLRSTPCTQGTNSGPPRRIAPAHHYTDSVLISSGRLPTLYHYLKSTLLDTAFAQPLSWGSSPSSDPAAVSCLINLE